MVRPTKDDRRRDIAQAALTAFTDKGYRLTQVSDVAKLAGVAAGTIYLFAKSKEELFWLALKISTGSPLESPASKQITGADLRSEFLPEDRVLSLRRILDSQDDLPCLREVLENHWAVVSHSARAIKLVERCAQDWPELAEAFYGDLRKSVVRDLAEYLTVAPEWGFCRRVTKPQVAARLIIETIAWFAMHRITDPDGRQISDEDAREVTIDALLHAYGAEKQ